MATAVKAREQAPPLSRRSFLKIAGLAGAVVQAGGLVAAGVATGRNPKTYTGWESYNPGTQFFNRKPFEYEYPAHKPVTQAQRPSHITDYVFGRIDRMQAALQENPSWKLGDPIANLGFPPNLVKFYEEFPERIEWDVKTIKETLPNAAEDRKVWGTYYLLAEAYSAGFSGHRANLERVSAPPDVWDFAKPNTIKPDKPEGDRIRDAVPFKSPELAAEFVKEIAHRYGATLVRITKTNPDFLYADSWRGVPEDYDFSRMPAHWEYSIVIGVPMEWDVVMASPQASTSSDAYDRVSMAAVRLTNALKFLGYPARHHSPFTNYDLIVPPIAVDAGMGEVGRTGFCITPELGGNCRTAIVTTSLPMLIDKPIRFGVKEFCEKCQLCATSCPSGAISTAENADGLVIRGYEHWYINNGACYNYWRESMGPMGCRLCVATCPYSRKDNWLHQAARTLDSNDPTGLVASGLVWMQENFFDAPEAIEYRRPAEGGHFASYRPEPMFLHADRFLDIPVTNPNTGG